MYFLGELSVEILMLISHLPSEASISVHSWSRAILYSYLSFGGTFSVSCPEIGGCLYNVSRRLKTHYFYGKFNWGHVVSPLYGDGLYLGQSVMGGSTVIIKHAIFFSLLPGFPRRSFSGSGGYRCGS